jgi:hypothetical protein
MATVPETRPAAKAFYATLHGLSGVIVRLAAQVLFVEPLQGAVVTLTDADQPHLVVLGQVDVAMAQYVTDMAAGGYAAVCTSRTMGVA